MVWASTTYSFWLAYSVQWFYKVFDYIWKFDHYIVKIYDIFSVFIVSYSYLVFKYHIMVYFNLTWSILGLVDLYDATWSSEYQNDMGVAIAS